MMLPRLTQLAFIFSLQAAIQHTLVTSLDCIADCAAYATECGKFTCAGTRVSSCWASNGVISSACTCNGVSYSITSVCQPASTPAPVYQSTGTSSSASSQLAAALPAISIAVTTVVGLAYLVI